MSSTDPSKHTDTDSANSPAATNSQWGGRFSESTDQFVQAFTASVDFDQRMYRQDIAGSRAHATMLTRIGVLSEDDLVVITEGLNAIEKDIAEGRFQWSVALEDVQLANFTAMDRDEDGFLSAQELRRRGSGMGGPRGRGGQRGGQSPQD